MRICGGSSNERLRIDHLILQRGQLAAKIKIEYYFDLLTVLIHKELKLKYKNTALGYLWSLVNPLAFAFVSYIAFKTIIKIQIENYLLFLLAALFPWYWFSNCLNGAPSIFLSNTSLIKKVNFPRALLLVSHVFLEMIHFVLSLPVIFLVVLIYGYSPHLIWLVGVPLLLVIQFATLYGLTLVVSSLNLFFRDLEKIINVTVTLLFYFTPIIYAENMVPDDYKALVDYNPLAALMLSWRSLFLEGALHADKVGISAVFALGTCVLAFVTYRRLSWRFAEVT